MTDHGGSCIETVWILSRKDFQLHVSLSVLSLELHKSDRLEEPDGPDRRLPDNRSLSDSEGSHSPRDDDLPCPA